MSLLERYDILQASFQLKMDAFEHPPITLQNMEQKKQLLEEAQTLQQAMKLLYYRIQMKKIDPKVSTIVERICTILEN